MPQKPFNKSVMQIRPLVAIHPKAVQIQASAQIISVRLRGQAPIVTNSNPL